MIGPFYMSEQNIKERKQTEKTNFTLAYLYFYYYNKTTMEFLKLCHSYLSLSLPNVFCMAYSLEKLIVALYILFLSVQVKFHFIGIFSFNIWINHGCQCSNIRRITRKVFELKAACRVFKLLPNG